MLQSNKTYLDLHQQYDRIFSHPNLMVGKKSIYQFLFVCSGANSVFSPLMADAI